MNTADFLILACTLLFAVRGWRRGPSAQLLGSVLLVAMALFGRVIGRALTPLFYRWTEGDIAVSVTLSEGLTIVALVVITHISISGFVRRIREREEAVSIVGQSISTIVGAAHGLAIGLFIFAFILGRAGNDPQSVDREFIEGYAGEFITTYDPVGHEMRRFADKLLFED